LAEPAIKILRESMGVPFFSRLARIKADVLASLSSNGITFKWG